MQRYGICNTRKDHAHSIALVTQLFQHCTGRPDVNCGFSVGLGPWVGCEQVRDKSIYNAAGGCITCWLGVVSSNRVAPCSMKRIRSVFFVKSFMTSPKKIDVLVATVLKDL